MHLNSHNKAIFARSMVDFAGQGDRMACPPVNFFRFSPFSPVSAKITALAHLLLNIH
jgi:hypothetical protein